jgi:hypothetical protein
LENKSVPFFLVPFFLELRDLLQSKPVVSTPVTRMVNSADGVRYVREVDVGRWIGADKFSGK